MKAEHSWVKPLGWLLLLCASLSLPSCGDEKRSGGESTAEGSAAGGSGAAGEGTEAGESGADHAIFRDHTSAAGLDFVHNNGARGERYIVETMGGGGGFVDVDLDGDLDIVLIDGGGLTAGAPPPKHRLFLNEGTGMFRDATEGSGIVGGAPGMGLAVGDIDNDGDPDLYITCFGANELYLNRGDGHFDRSDKPQAQSDIDTWSTSANFFDADRDGALDLYVASYVVFSIATHKRCERRGVHAYCVPRDYPGALDHLLVGDGKGGFSDVSVAQSIRTPGTPGRGLGVVASDFDDDGDDDLYVANDMDLNFLLRNTLDEGTPGFREEAVFFGASASEDGRPEAGMGVDAGDADGDGDFDLIVTNFENQTNAFYRNDQGEYFVEMSSPVGMGVSTLRRLAFGCRFLDHDLDGDLDLFVVNGHVDDNAPKLNQGSLYAQPDQLFENRGQKFVEVLEAAYADGKIPTLVSRALASGDIDGDGDLDLLIVSNGGPVTLLENLAPRDRPRLGLDLEGVAPSNRDAYGAKVTVTAAGVSRVFEVRAGSSYLASHDPRIFVATPRASEATVTVRWPSGRVETWEGIATGSLYTIVEGEGPRAGTPFVR